MKYALSRILVEVLALPVLFVLVMLLSAWPQIIGVQESSPLGDLAIVNSGIGLFVVLALALQPSIWRSNVTP